MNTAYSVESLLDEIVFMVGPIITTLCAINVGPYAGVLAAAIFLSIGSILFIAQKGTEPMPHPKIKGVKEILYPGQSKFKRFKSNLKKEINISKAVLKDLEYLKDR